MKDDKETFEEPMQWIAFKNQFFSSVLIANQNFDNVTLDSQIQKEGSGYMKNYNAEMTTFFDPTGKKATELQMYLGPNHFKTLLATNNLVINQEEDAELEDLEFREEDLKELKRLLEEYTSTDEVKVEKVIKIKL